MVDSKEIYTIPQAAKICGYHRTTLWRYVKDGGVRTFKTPRGQDRIYGKDLKKFMQSKGINPFSLQDPEKIKILIVDDDPKIRKLLRRVLNGNNCETEFASDGFEAGRKISKHLPHLVILDLFMPEIDGFKICKQLKGDPETADITIFAISGFDTSENKQKILDCGADQFLTKPLDTGILKKMIKKLLA